MVSRRVQRGCVTLPHRSKIRRGSSDATAKLSSESRVGGLVGGTRQSVMVSRVVSDKLGAAGSLIGRRWLATPARGDSVAISLGFGREPSLGAVRCEPSGSCRDLRPSIRGWCSFFGGRPRLDRMGAASRGSDLRVGAGPSSVRRGRATSLWAGARDLSTVRTRKGRPMGERARESRDWRLWSYSGVAPEDREGEGERSSDGLLDAVDRKTSRPRPEKPGQRRRGRAKPIGLYDLSRSSKFG